VKGQGFESSPKVPYSSRIDFPIFNEKYRYSKYCYVYGTSQKIDNINFNKYAIVKKDVCDTSGDKSWALDNNYPSETLFVATPGGTREDDGILISHVFDDVLDETNLYIINATTMETVVSSAPSNGVVLVLEEMCLKHINSAHGSGKNLPWIATGILVGNLDLLMVSIVVALII
jgi:hypothetical protein